MVDKGTLSVTLGSSADSSVFAVPVTLKGTFRLLSPLEEAIYCEVLYRAVHVEDKRKGVEAAYWLCEPDPWLIAIAYIMWQGIIQGLSWDLVKGLVKNALTTLRSHRFAPSQTFGRTTASEAKEVDSDIELGFSWHKYANDGRKQYHLYVGLKRVYNEKTKSEKQAICRSEVSNRIK